MITAEERKDVKVVLFDSYVSSPELIFGIEVLEG